VFDSHAQYAGDYLAAHFTNGDNLNRAAAPPSMETIGN